MNFKAIYIDENIKSTKLAQEIERKYPHKTTVNKFSADLDFFAGKKYLALKSAKGEFLRSCASLNENEYCCCNTYVISTISQCPFTCTYCFLPSYLNTPYIYVISDLDKIVAEIKNKVQQEPNKLFRIGTWELGDSLALETITKQAEYLINNLVNEPNILLDLRTKSANVSNLLKLKHQNRVVVSWTLNPQPVISMYEKGTASLDSRLKAMCKVISAGYKVSLHFDPMLIHSNWQKNYKNLIDTIFNLIPIEKITWISIGSMRFTVEMKKIIEKQFPASDILDHEIVLGNDNKLRYVKPLRIKLYKNLYQAIINNLNWQKISPQDRPFIYLCMERADMWQKIFGYAPKNTQEVDRLLTQKCNWFTV